MYMKNYGYLTSNGNKDKEEIFNLLKNKIISN